MLHLVAKPRARGLPRRRPRDALRQRIGVKIENTIEPWNYEATRDGIRHYAHGIGDDNPLWCDPAYGTGNWSFNTAWAATLADHAFVTALPLVFPAIVLGLGQAMSTR